MKDRKAAVRTAAASNADGFHIEGALTPDDGNAAGLTFQRRSTVSLAGAFGEVRLGRDYAPTFWNTNVFNPFGQGGVGGAQTLGMLAGVAGAVSVGQFTCNNNSIGYFLPGNLGGFYGGQAQYAFGENASNATTDAGDYFGVRVG